MADDVRISKSLSYWLRHRPDAGGLELDEAGWAPTAAVLEALKRSGIECDAQRLAGMVRRSDKQRFEYSPGGEAIRARQGHSVDVELGWPPATPPETLYHGTVDRFVAAIGREGLRAMKRHHVHLSPDVETAQRVGSRRGKAVVLRIDSAAMARAGHVFYLTANGVWLTGHVPPEFLRPA
ncbi:MAG TPA: RNA 2'-phosphotransferase [Allosphingosinicella sp.]|jgi:putative RNA 2'-phosphotransferase